MDSCHLHFVSDSFANYTRWDPIPEMFRSDADVILKPIGKANVKYNRPVDDPLFAAHTTRGNVTSRAGTPLKFYYSDFPMSTFGCAQQVCILGNNSRAHYILTALLVSVLFPQSK
jgi:hypothetical protein